MSKIKIGSWDDQNGRWLAVGEKYSQATADEDVARRFRIATEQRMPRTTFYASGSAPTCGPRALGLPLTPDVPDDAPPPKPRERKLGKHSPGAREVTLQVRGHVDDADVVWFGVMCWPRDVFEAAGGVVIERDGSPS